MRSVAGDMRICGALAAGAAGRDDDGVHFQRCEGGMMAGQIPTGDIHHLRLTVTDLQRSRDFYTSLLGFQVAAESPPPGDPAAGKCSRFSSAGWC